MSLLCHLNWSAILKISFWLSYKICLLTIKNITIFRPLPYLYRYLKYFTLKREREISGSCENSITGTCIEINKNIYWPFVQTIYYTMKNHCTESLIQEKLENVQQFSWLILTDTFILRAILRAAILPWAGLARLTRITNIFSTPQKKILNQLKDPFVSKLNKFLF